MNPNGNEVDKFFEGLPSQDKKVADVFNDKPVENAPVIPAKETEEETVEEGRKNRRHRRLEEQLQRERDSNIALNERIKTLSEVQQFEREFKDNSSVDEDLHSALFGNLPETPESKVIAIRLQKVLERQAEGVKQQTLQEFEERQLESQREQKGFETFIDSELESLEDEYNVDLTSDAPKARKARRELLEMVQNLSPKDEDGTLTGYADFSSTFDLYQKNQSQDKSPEIANRQKEIASRTMQKSNQNNNSNSPQITPGFRGWMKDYGINN